MKIFVQYIEVVFEKTSLEISVTISLENIVEVSEKTSVNTTLDTQFSRVVTNTQ